MPFYTEYIIGIDESVRSLPPMGAKINVTFSVSQFMKNEQHEKDGKTHQVPVWYDFSVYNKPTVQIDVEFLVMSSRGRK